MTISTNGQGRGGGAASNGSSGADSSRLPKLDSRSILPRQQAQPGSDGRRARTVGILEWFRVGERARVERVLGRLEQMNIRHLRTGISWADWYSPGGQKWYDWLIPFLAERVELLPCITYTPPSIAVAPMCSAPPREVKAFADFLDLLITRHGEHFEYVDYGMSRIISASGIGRWIRSGGFFRR